MDTDKLLQVTEQTLLDNVNLALVFASAMAWNEVIKVFAARFMKGGSGEMAVLMYAVFLTLLMVVLQIVGKGRKRKTVSL